MAPSDFFLGIAIFTAAAVEAIEAITVILAIGIARGWRSVWYAVIAGLLTLGAIVAILGYSLLFIPLRSVWLIGGTVLLIFGVQWIHKALLRYCGLKPERDELEAFDKVRRAALKNKKRGYLIDWYGFVITYKAILLEGLEIIFIVLAFGAATANLALGINVSVIAIVIVSVIAAIIHRPLAKLPENSMKFVVGLLLASFGTVFASSGAGIIWINEYAIFMIITALYLIVSILTLYILSSSPGAKMPKKQTVTVMIVAAAICVAFGVFLFIVVHNNPLPFVDLSSISSGGLVV